MKHLPLPLTCALSMLPRPLRLLLRLPSPSPPASKASKTTTQPEAPLDVPTFLARLKVATFMTLWFLLSIASLFVAKHTLHRYHLNEALFSHTQFLLSVIFGLTFTKLFNLHPLTPLHASQLRSILPLSATFLIKEVLKYAALSRVSVNLVNTIRSLGPLFNVLLEFLFLSHRPQSTILYALVPIIAGVALTSIDEIHHASTSVHTSAVIAVVGTLAAIFSTAINNGQNIYSKILFGRERIDPVSLQIYLSAISFALITPFTTVQLFLQTFVDVRASEHFHLAFETQHQSSSIPAVVSRAWATTSTTLQSFPNAIVRNIAPSSGAVGAIVAAGLVNFIASQLAFNTLRLVSPLSYSVANTFKRVAIALIAIGYFNERLSMVNAIGIGVSIVGVFVYERKARELKQVRQYRMVDVGENYHSANVGKGGGCMEGVPIGEVDVGRVVAGGGGGGRLPSRKQTTSGPDLTSMAAEGFASVVDSADSSLVGTKTAVLRHLYIDVARTSQGKGRVVPATEVVQARV